MTTVRTIELPALCRLLCQLCHLELSQILIFEAKQSKQVLQEGLSQNNPIILGGENFTYRQ